MVNFNILRIVTNGRYENSSLINLIKTWIFLISILDGIGKTGINDKTVKKNL